MSVLEPRTRARKSDRRYFQRFPHRRHRIRATFRGEVEALGLPPPPEGLKLFTLSRRAPGFGIFKVYLPAPPDTDLDAMDEAEVSSLFDFGLSVLTPNCRLVVETTEVAR